MKKGAVSIILACVMATSLISASCKTAETATNAVPITNTNTSLGLLLIIVILIAAGIIVILTSFKKPHNPDQVVNHLQSNKKQSASANSGWSTFGNVMWLIFGGGLSTCLEYALAGIVSCITLIGIPFGIQYFKLAGLVILPFGKQVVTEKEGCLMTGMNILWIFTVGLPVTLTHLFWGIILTITIIGFPFAKQHFKLMVLSFTPFGKRVY